MKYSVGLTSIRFFAFFLVFCLHGKLLDFGYLGVHIFFVLSGFLLIPIICESKSTLTTKNFFINFYGRRFLRIIPLYFIFLILISILFYNTNSSQLSGKFLFQKKLFFEQLPWAASYTYNFFHISYLYKQSFFLTHFWSLSVEEQFYVFFPIIFYFIRDKNINIALIFIFFLALLLRLITFLIFIKFKFEIFISRPDLVIYLLPFSHLDAFACGGFFALNKIRIKKKYFYFMTIALVVLSYLTYQNSIYYRGDEFFLRNLGFQPFLRDSYKFIWAYSLFSIFFSSLFSLIKYDNFLFFILQNSLIHYLGKITYGLYVFHFPILWLVKYLAIFKNKYCNLTLALSLTIIIATISYELYEKKFLKLKDRFFPKQFN